MRVASITFDVGGRCKFSLSHVTPWNKTQKKEPRNENRKKIQVIIPFRVQLPRAQQQRPEYWGFPITLAKRKRENTDTCGPLCANPGCVYLFTFFFRMTFLMGDGCMRAFNFYIIPCTSPLFFPHSGDFWDLWICFFSLASLVVCLFTWF